MDVAVDRFGIQLVRISRDLNRSAPDVQVEPAIDSTDIDVCGCCLHPEANTSWYPDLEARRLRIAIVHRFHEHLGAGVAPTHEEVVAGAERASHHDGVLVPAVHYHAADHVDDSERAFHSEGKFALDLLLRDDRR